MILLKFLISPFRGDGQKNQVGFFLGLGPGHNNFKVSSRFFKTAIDTKRFNKKGVDGYLYWFDDTSPVNKSNTRSIKSSRSCKG